MSPKVSVVVPNYNHAAYLPQRLDSILAQDFRDFEVVILDDASSDGSHEVIARYTKDRRVTFLPNATNSGCPFVQWNRGVAAARGEFVWIAESDDFAAPTFLATLVRRLQADPRCVLAYCQSWRVDESSVTLGTLADVWDPALEPARWQSDYNQEGPIECGRFLIHRNTIPNASAVVFRRDAYLRSGGAPEHMRLCGDWFAWAQLLQLGRIAYAAQPLNYFREHPATVRAATDWRRHLYERWETQSAILARGSVPTAVARALARTTLADLLGQVLPAPRGTRLAVWRDGLRRCGPILRRSPATTAATLLDRASTAVSRRLRRSVDG